MDEAEYTAQRAALLAAVIRSEGQLTTARAEAGEALARLRAIEAVLSRLRMELADLEDGQTAARKIVEN